MIKWILPLSVLFISLASPGQQAEDFIKVTDMLKIKSIGSVTLNKSGTMAAFTVNSIEPDGDSKLDFKYSTHLFIVPSDGSELPRQLTIKESSSQPAWSPDGEQLAFVRTVDGKPQVFLLPVHGGEPVQFTHFRYGASNPKWSPDGRKILFSSTISMKDLLKDSSLNPEYSLPKWPYEQPGFERNASLLLPVARPDPDGNLDEIRAYLDGNISDKKAKVINKLNFQDEQSVVSEIYFNHFFIQAVSPKAQPYPVTHGFFSFSNAFFAGPGDRLLLNGDLDSATHPDRALEREIYIGDSLGNNLHRLHGETGKIFEAVSVSPSGNWLAFQTSPVLSEDNAELYIQSLKDKTKPVVHITLDRGKSNVTWSSDENWIYFTAASNGGIPLYRANIQSGAVERLSDFDGGISSFDVGGNHLVYVRTAASNPYELYCADAGMQQRRVISQFNSEWLGRKRLSLPEKHTVKNSAGMDVDYWVMKPVNYVEGRKYPLLLEIHGGPAGMWGPGEATMWHEFQLFCSKGIGVVYCNPRGSGGYGSEFARAIIRDWGEGPARDVLTALDSCVSEGWADTSRLLVTGGSYGGYLVAWIISHDHRFLAACSQRGVYDLSVFFGEGNAWRLVPVYFGGYPWEPAVRSLLEKESPATYVQDITTPYIIFHGENDRRTGFVQGEMMYRSLKMLNRPVEYVRHPGATHEITRSGDNRQRIDQLLRTYEFFERWIRKQHFRNK